MKVFATNWLETAADDADGGNDWTWNPVYGGNQQTGPGKPTNSLIQTKMGGQPDQNKDNDQPAEHLGMLVA